MSDMRHLLNLLETLAEYQEEEDGTFTHNGREYNLNAVLAQTENRELYHLPVADMKWVIAYDEPDQGRLEIAELDAPLLVTVWDGKLTVLDGLHRVAKAVRNDIDTLPAQVISPCRLPEFLVNDAKESVCDDSSFELYHGDSHEDNARLWFFIPEISDEDSSGQLSKASGTLNERLAESVARNMISSPRKSSKIN